MLHLLLLFVLLLPLSFSQIQSAVPQPYEAGLYDLSAVSDGEALQEGIVNDGFFELDSGDSVYPQEPFLRGQGLRLQVLPKQNRERLEIFKRQDEMLKDDVDIERDKVRISTGTGVQYIPTEYYFRKSPLEDILARGIDIFFIAGGFPQFPSLGNDSSPGDVKDNKMASLAEETGNMQVFLLNEDEVISYPSYEIVSHDRPPLKIYSDNQSVDKLLDGLMGFSEIQQFSFFQEDYLKQYHPQEGDLARLTRDLIHKNLCNVIVIYNPISTAFDFVEQLFFSKPLDKLYREYWWAHPGTKTGAEFLFCQAAHYDFEKRALAYLVEAYAEAKRVVAEYYTRTDVYQKRAKAYVLVEIHDALMRALKDKGYGSLDEAFARYVSEQERIYRLIISFHGEEKNSARYALGQLYWDEGEYARAIAEWKEIDNSYDYSTYNAMKKVYSGNDDLENIVPRIKEILMRENEKSNTNLMDRLVKFHRWKKREKKVIAM